LFFLDFAIGSFLHLVLDTRSRGLKAINLATTFFAYTIYS